MAETGVGYHSLEKRNKKEPLSMTYQREKLDLTPPGSGDL